MKFKNIILLLVIVLLGACSKKDPILPGDRAAIFPSSDIIALDKTIDNIPSKQIEQSSAKCEYTQDASNIIWDGDKKIFSGFPTPNFIKGYQKPVCEGNFVYAGLSTGELVKVNAKTKDLLWVADIYKSSNITGGASATDIIVPAIITKDSVFVGGLGDAFCKINKLNGNKRWCQNIGVSTQFILTDTFVFIVGTDKHLYALSATSGDVYWKTPAKLVIAPVMADNLILVGKEKFNITDGSLVK